MDQTLMYFKNLLRISQNFQKLKEAGRDFLGENQSCRTSELFGTACCVSILKI